MTGAQIERERAKARRSRDNTLTDAEYDEFEDILNNLTVSRKDILTGMAFALDFADMATEVLAGPAVLFVVVCRVLIVAALVQMVDCGHAEEIASENLYACSIENCAPLSDV